MTSPIGDVGSERVKNLPKSAKGEMREADRSLASEDVKYQVVIFGTGKPDKRVNHSWLFLYTYRLTKEFE